MALWGQNNNAESRDVTHVLLSPRMGGCKSPLNRKMPSKKAIEMVEPCAMFDVFKSDDDGEDVMAGEDGHGDFQSLPSSKRMTLEPSASSGDLYKDYVTQLSRQFSVAGKKSSSSKYTGFYIFASLVFMFLLLKISSLGWLAVQTHSASSPMVYSLRHLQSASIHNLILSVNYGLYVGLRIQCFPFRNMHYAMDCEAEV